MCRLVFAKGSGSGFHYGNGWIVTNSHVVGPDAGNVPSMVVHFTNGRVNLVVPARPRRCYFIDIDYKSGEADFQHADVAMFQLTDDEMRVSTAVHGVDQLPSMTHASVGAVRLTEPAPVQVGDYLRCLHHGGGSGQKRVALQYRDALLVFNHSLDWAILLRLCSACAGLYERAGASHP